MEMPEIIYVWPTNPESDCTADYFADKSNWNDAVTTPYHHSRIHQEVIRQRDELQAKLDKANNTGEIITAKLNDLESAFSKLCLTHSVKLEHLEKTKDCLGQISRMTTLPDHASNTMTLAAAHQRARTTLEEIE